MIKHRLILALIFALSFECNYLLSQIKDTIFITSKNINPNVLIEGTHTYLVYFKMKKDGPRAETQFWTRNIKRATENGKSVIKVDQIWEHKDTIMHTVSSVCDSNTLQPFTHDFWWKSRPKVKVDFNKNLVLVNDEILTDTTSAKSKKAIWNAYKSVKDNFFLNWHMDLEVFPTLPYKEDVTFIIPYYDLGTSAPLEKVAYTVTGSAKLNSYESQSIDCWIMEHNSKGNKEVYWISKKTKEVLKMEQEVNGTMYRYKIKLGFSV